MARSLCRRGSDRCINNTETTLLDLPASALVSIAELLPCRDLPSLVATCKDLSAMATSFYGYRQCVDMRCFSKVTPRLCMQVIDRFCKAKLTKCVFKCDLSHHASSSPAILKAILERFLDNYRCNDELLRDLHAIFASDCGDWFRDDPALRPIDVLAHCFLLEQLLKSQPGLKELILDAEFSIFRIPKTKAYRQHWYLMQPFISLQTINQHCPNLQRYMSSTVKYQSSTVDMKHIQIRFLQHSSQLTFLGIRFGLDPLDLDIYEYIKSPLLLQKAVFLLHKWHPFHHSNSLPDLQQNQNLTSTLNHSHSHISTQSHSTSTQQVSLTNHNQSIHYRRMRSFAQKLPHLSCVAIAFNSRGSLPHAAHFLLHLPSISSLCIKCEFNPGFPSFDIDDDPLTSGPFFRGVASVISPSVKKLSLLDVPEDELALILDGPEKLPSSLLHIRIRFLWSSSSFDKQKQDMLASFLDRSKNLISARFEAYSSASGQEQAIFSKLFTR